MTIHNRTYQNYNLTKTDILSGISFNRKVFLVVGFLLLYGTIYGQNQVTGIILDAESKQPLLGATVSWVDNPSSGTTTDFEGGFSIPFEQSGQLSISYVGFITEIIQVNQPENIEILLQPSPLAIDAVVVTALGISREEKSLGYSVQTVEASTFANNTSVNILSKLSGQIAGLNISPSGGGPAGSNRVLIRGSSSLTGSDQPLFVIDGLVVNSEPGDNRATQDGGLDYGDPLSTINPDDIESVTVLKGPGATALYGSLGTNGVIVIETKKGVSSAGLSIQLSSSVTTEQPYIFPNFQNEFGRGSQGTFTPFNVLTFGPAYDGSTFTNWLNIERPYEPVESQMKDFFRNGLSTAQNIQLSGGDKKSQFLLSGSLFDYQAPMPNSNIGRKTIAISYRRQFNESFRLTTKVNYFNQNVFNRPNLGGSPDNPVRNFYRMPRSVHLQDLQPYIDESGLVITWDGKTQGSFNQNPYWGVNLNTNEDQRNRLVGSIAMDINLTGQLKSIARAGWDYITDQRESRIAPNTVYKTSPVASFDYRVSNRLVSNYDLLLTWEKDLGSFSTILTAGTSTIDTKFNSLASRGDDLVNPDLWVINNFKEIESSQGIAQRRINSVFSTIDIDWKNDIYLNLTFRNDWSSVLPKENRSFAYWSSNLSWLVNESFPSLPDLIDYLKVRASYAKVGNANSLSTGALFFTYTPSTGHLGQPFTRVPRIGPNPLIKPERTTAIELGVDMRLFEGKLNIDLSWYRNDSFDQIFTAPVASSTGFENQWINSGSIRNQGLEIILSSKVLNNNEFSWQINANAALNDNQVLELTEELPILILGGSRSGISIQARADQRSDLLVGTRLLKDNQGELILDDFSLPQTEIEEDGNSDFILGQVQPDWLLGFNSTLSYKSFSFYFAVDAQFGGSIYSSSYAAGSALGTLSHTLPGRAEWYQSEAERISLNYRPEDWVPTNGLNVSGINKDGQKVESILNPQRYWNRVSGINQANVFDSSFVRLREISFSMNISDLFKDSFLKDFRLSLFGSNLGYLLKNTPGFAPQSSLSSGKAQGIESYAFPELRNFGARINIGI